MRYRRSLPPSGLASRILCQRPGPSSPSSARSRRYGTLNPLADPSACALLRAAWVTSGRSP
eukprot:7446136-Prorocentrum_lima.AAC.1